MEVKSVLRMVGGTGDNSYLANSTFQRRIALEARFVVKEAVEALLSTVRSSENLLVFADLGCSTGANTFIMFSEVMDFISTTYTKLGRPVPEIQLLLNDLPGNDFNTLLGPVLSSYKDRINESMRDNLMPFYTAAAVPGSFYGRLFPKTSVHFIYSAQSLHWLSEAPLGLNNASEGSINKGSIYISKKSPPLVSKLYLKQFQKNFSIFLKHRCEELQNDGYMALLFAGRSCVDPTVKEYYSSWLEEALNNMVSKGVVTAADVDSFNLPWYFPPMEEVKSIIQNEGSFHLIQHHVFETLYSDVFSVTPGDHTEKWDQKIAQQIRAVFEPLVVSHFGDSIIEELFSTMSEVIALSFHEEKPKFVTHAISLKKKATSI